MTSTPATYVLAGLLALASLPAMAKTVHVAIDLSVSVPIVTNKDFARRTAAFVETRIRGLEIGDKVALRFLGAYGLSENIRRLDLKVSKRDRAPELAAAVGRIVASIPSLVAQKKLAVQNATNLIGYFEAESPLLACATEATEIVVVSDGVESSSVVKADALIAGKAKLPKPRADLLKGCALTILGIGQLAQGADAAITRRLDAEWRRWSGQAGVARFEALPHF